MIAGTTGTGLDRLITLIGTDEGLAARLPAEDIEAGARAANRMNEIIVEGIQALGIANDSSLTASDVRDLSDWIATNHALEFRELHGDDNGKEESGFHRIQNDGDAIDIFGDDLVDTVADGLYHLVFGYRNGRIINEDGNQNAELDDMAWWLGELLENELAAAAAGSGPLYNASTDPWLIAQTGTGLDTIGRIILDDPGLQHRIPTSEIREGAAAGVEIAGMIVDAILAEGLANDGVITPSDVYLINEVIRSDAATLARFIALHGDDEGNIETGFHLVQADGAETRLYGDNAVDTVADGIFHIGFDIEKGRFVNEDGNRNASVSSVAAWIQNLLNSDLQLGLLVNDRVDPVGQGSTGTGLDRLVAMIGSDIRLNQRISTADIADGAMAADVMNTLLRDGIVATGAANDGRIQTSDMRDINAWLRSDPDRLKLFMTAHGDDENDTETGFHLVQNDGASSRMFGENALDTVADGIYHFGFEIAKDRFLNEDGNRNQSVEDVAAWVNELLSHDDMASLANPQVVTHVVGTTGSGLDLLVEVIADDPGLTEEIATSQIVAGAEAVDALNQMILQGLVAVGAGQDGRVSSHDVHALNDWIRSDPARQDAFLTLRGVESDGGESGFQAIHKEGADTYLYGRNAVDHVIDGLFHIGLIIEKDRFLDEGNRKGVSVSTLSEWLTELLSGDIARGALYNPDYDPDRVDLDALDAGLVRTLDSVTPDGSTGYIELPDDTDLDLPALTIMLDVTAHTLAGDAGIFSRDGSGLQDGGHVTMLRSGSDLKVRVQTAESESWLRVRDVFELGETRNIALTLDGNTAALYVDGRLYETERTTANWLQADEDITIGANAWSQSDSADNRVKQVFDGRIDNLRIYDSALTVTEIRAVTGLGGEAADPAASEPVVPLPSGTTGTGLDRLVDIITLDVGLERRVADEDVVAGATAADQMNGYIVEAIHATGVGNDGALSAGDIRDLSRWIIANRKMAFIEAHGNDEKNAETGFHRVQNDGAKSRLFGDNAVDTVADGLYHLPFGYRDDRIINEDGNRNEKLEDLAWWLESLLASELAQAASGNGPLHNPDANPTAVALTGTGLDRIVDVIFTDPGIQRNVATSDAQTAAVAASAISQMIIDSVIRLGLVDDGDLTPSDVRAINADIRADASLYQSFVEWHGDDEKNGISTGFHLVQNDGDVIDLYGDDALDTVADGIFHIGFEIEGDRFRNEDGNRNASVEDVAYWLGQLLADDIASGALGSGQAHPGGSTGTGLDRLVELILSDPGLERKVSELEMREAAAAGDAIGHMIIDAIKATGVASNGEIKTSDVYDINAYIRQMHYEAFVRAHGNDEGGVETGFHLVQNDGATTRLFGDKAVDTVIDGIYHLGFEIEKDRLQNEDGNRNASVHSIAGWLTSLLTEADFQALSAQSASNPYIRGTTGTGLDTLVNAITDDDGLINRIATSEIRAAAEAAQAMNEIILEVIYETGVANDGDLSAFDVLEINQAIRSDPQYLSRFTALHGRDEKDGDTGFHRVEGDGARTEIFGRNAIDTVADGIYHLGFEVERGRFVDEEGKQDVSVETVADWLSLLLADDLESGALQNPNLLPSALDLQAIKDREVLSLDQPMTVSKNDGELEIESAIAFAVPEATVLVRITPFDAEDGDRDVFFSRDGRGYQDGGHLSMWLEDGDLVARFQSDADEIYLRAREVIENNSSYAVGFTFDGAEARLYLDGTLLDVEQSEANWLFSDEALVFGGSQMQRQEGSTRIDDRFEGVIEEAYVFSSALNFIELLGVASPDYELLG